MAALTLDAAGSFHFVYVGVGLGATWFSGGASFSNDTTGGVMGSSAPLSVGGYVEAGLTTGLFIPTTPTSAFELRPAVGLGYWAMQSPTQSIENCGNCDSRAYDYTGGGYLRFQLGLYYARRPAESLVHHVLTWESHFFHGPTVSLQQFVLGAQPRPESVLTLGYTVGVGP